MATIVIDPGHGGSSDLPCSDANHAVGPATGTREKTLTLDVGLRLRRELEHRGGHTVFMTRDKDTNISGSDRARTAKKHNADVLVSIHFNASDLHNAQGTETWMHAHSSSTGASARLCRAVQAAVVRVTGLDDRNRHHPPHFVKKAGYCVLNPSNHASKTAAVLVEVSFLDRADEDLRLQRDSYKEEIANGIANGIESYLGIGIEAVAELVADDVEVEDAPALAALLASSARQSMPETVASETRAVGGHALPDDVGELGAEEAPSPAHSPLARSMVESILRDAQSLDPSGADDVFEFSQVQIGDAPDFAGARTEAAAAEIVGGILAAPEAENFDYPSFEEFIRSLKLSHFTPAELLFLGASNESGPCANRNSLPPRSLWPNIRNTAIMLDRIREELGAKVRILSCYRNASYNSCISGAGGSFHMRFNAIDWRCNTGTVQQWREAARRVRASEARFRGGIGFYPNSGFIHIDTRGTNRNWTG